MLQKWCVWAENPFRPLFLSVSDAVNLTFNTGSFFSQLQRWPPKEAPSFYIFYIGRKRDALKIWLERLHVSNREKRFFQIQEPRKTHSSSDGQASKAQVDLQDWSRNGFDIGLES